MVVHVDDETTGRQTVPHELDRERIFDEAIAVFIGVRLGYDLGPVKLFVDLLTTHDINEVPIRFGETHQRLTGFSSGKQGNAVIQVFNPDPSVNVVGQEGIPVKRLRVVGVGKVVDRWNDAETGTATRSTGQRAVKIQCTLDPTHRLAEVMLQLWLVAIREIGNRVREIVVGSVVTKRGFAKRVIHRRAEGTTFDFKGMCVFTAKASEVRTGVQSRSVVKPGATDRRGLIRVAETVTDKQIVIVGSFRDGPDGVVTVGKAGFA